MESLIINTNYFRWMVIFFKTFIQYVDNQLDFVFMIGDICFFIVAKVKHLQKNFKSAPAHDFMWEWMIMMTDPWTSINISLDILPIPSI